MLKKAGTIVIGFILIFSLAASPVFGASSSQSIEKKADSWRYDNGEVDTSVDKNVYNGETSTMGSNAGGCTVAWSKLNGEFYNSKGSVIKGAYRKGMDVSSWQKNIDWAKVKKSSDIDFVIIRCGYGTNKTAYDDKKWLRNVEACEKYGIPYGVYIYSYATSLSNAKSEANHVLRLLKGHTPDYPVYYDLEDKTVKAKGKANIKAYANTFCSMIEDAGYDAGIYASLTWWRKYLDSSDFDKYDKWVAQWSTKCTYEKSYRLWQCTSSGSVPGVSGRVDLNFDFKSTGSKSSTTSKTSSTTTTSSTQSSTTSSSSVTQTTVSYTAVTTENVNYRTGPAKTYTKKGTYKKGTTVSVTAECSNGWVKLSNGYYLNADYIKKSSTVQESSSAAYQVKTTDNLNYRTGPGTKYKKKGTYKKGTILTVESTSNGWGKLSNGYYIYLKYTKKQ